MMFFLYSLYTIFVLIIGMKTAEKWYQMSGELEKMEHSELNLIYNDTSNKTSENVSENEKEVSEFVPNHLPDDCCSFRVAKFINPYKDVCAKGKSEVVSVCLKCAMCLAVSEKIKSIFDGTEQYTDLSSKCLNEDLECKLNTVCKNGFKNYDLRNYKGHAIVTETSENTNHVKSVLDGIWTISLQKMCSDFLHNMVVSDVYVQHKIEAIELNNFLCRGSGIFRECQNIHFEEIKIPNEGSRKYWINCLF